VIEPTYSLERAFFAFLVEAYREYPGGRSGAGEGEVEVVLHLHPRLAPITAAVLPLVRKDGLPEIAEEITRELRQHHFVQYDESGSIGRRYRRHDEIGTPWCVTVDGQTRQDGTVTVRDRDTMKQDRVQIVELASYVAARLG
jgi:glycyl-tRNA synthetase